MLNQKSLHSFGKLGFPGQFLSLPFLCFSLLIFSAAHFPPRLSAQELQNGNFAQFDSSNVPTHWHCDSIGVCQPEEDGVRVTIQNRHSNDSALSQSLPVRDPDTRLVLSGTITSDIPNAAYLQVKLFKNHKESQRISSRPNGKNPSRVSLSFSPGDADSMQITCRLKSARGVGNSACFSDLKLERVPANALFDWNLTSGSGNVENPPYDSKVRSSFTAFLAHGKAERFASVGEDFHISQPFQFPKNHSGKWEFSARLQAEFVKFGWLKLELFRDGKRLKECVSPRNRWCTDTLRIVFDSDNADSAILHFVFDGRQKFFGERVACSQIYFGQVRPDFTDAKAPAPSLDLVPAFESAGFRLQNCTAETAGQISAKLEYRLKSDSSQTSSWLPALPPVYLPEERSLCGVLVNLKEGTPYELRLTVKDAGTSKTWTRQFQTQTADVKIWKTIELSPENLTFPIQSFENGSSEKGFVRYVLKPGTTLDGGEEAECVFLFQDAKYIILDGMKLRGGGRNTIEIRNSSNIRIQNCDISGFGRIGEQRFDLDGKFYLPNSQRALNNDAGIRIENSHAILVEKCFIHDPRGTSNSWFYSHPAGPNAVFVGDTSSLTLRWNDFIGSDLHRWNDTVEGMHNGSNSGSVRRDAEIYGNYFGFGNDDGIELDGGQINCRYFRNHTEGHLCGASTAPCKRGPSYLFQNLFSNPGDEFGLVGVGFKNNYQNIGAGPTFFISNTILEYSTSFSSPGGTKEEYESLAAIRPFKGFARNNLSQGASAPSKDFFQFLQSDFDWNLYSANCAKDLEYLRKIGQEKNALLGEAEFTDKDGGIFTLAENSPGKAAGTFVPNVLPIQNPDLGACVPGSGITQIPHRPAPFTISTAHVDLSFSSDSSPLDSQTIQITAEKTMRFTIAQPEGADFFTVSPSSGKLKAGETLTLTVKPRPEGLRNARKNCSAFAIRTPDGLSRPVSVTVDSRSNMKLAEKDRKGAIYGKILSNRDGEAEIELDIPEDGDYWLFIRTRNGAYRKLELSLNGKEPCPSLTLGPRGSAEMWKAVTSRVFSGEPNRPFFLKKGKNRFTLKSGRSRNDELLISAAVCQNPNSFRLNPEWNGTKEEK